MMIFHELGSFCKSVHWSFVVVVLNCSVLMGNVQGDLRAK